jgi:hypothetical protein
MRRMVAVALVAAMLATGCSMHRSARFAVGPGQAYALRDQAVSASYAEKLPIGSKVKVALRSGRAFAATFMGVEGDAVRLQERTRIPEDPFLLPLADLSMLAVDQGGIGAARAFLIGAGAGAATFFALLALAAAAWAD